MSNGFPWHIESQSFDFNRSEDFSTTLWIPLHLGFYDVISGPSTGLLLAKANKSYLNLGLLNAVATAKSLNLMTDTGALVIFFFAGKIIWVMAIPMIVGNVIGNWFGSHLAMKKWRSFCEVYECLCHCFH